MFYVTYWYICVLVWFIPDASIKLNLYLIYYLHFLFEFYFQRKPKYFDLKKLVCGGMMKNDILQMNRKNIWCMIIQRILDINSHQIKSDLLLSRPWHWERFWTGLWFFLHFIAMDVMTSEHVNELTMTVHSMRYSMWSLLIPIFLFNIGNIRFWITSKYPRR